MAEPTEDVAHESDPTDRSEGALAEYSALRQEVLERIKAQQQLLSLQLTVTATVFGFAISQQHATAILLIVPFSSYLLCGRLVSHHNGTVRVAEYIERHLSDRVPGGLGWEAWLRQAYSKPRHTESLLPLLLTFGGASGLALASTLGYVYGPGDDVGLGSRVGWSAVWIAGLAATVLSVMLLLRKTKRAAGPAGAQAGQF